MPSRTRRTLPAVIADANHASKPQPPAPTQASIKYAQESHPDLRALKTFLQEYAKSGVQKVNLLKTHDIRAPHRFHLEPDGLITFESHDSRQNTSHRAVVLPHEFDGETPESASLRTWVLHEYHNTPSGAHRRASAMLHTP